MLALRVAPRLLHNLDNSDPSRIAKLVQDVLRHQRIVFGAAQEGDPSKRPRLSQQDWNAREGVRCTFADQNNVRVTRAIAIDRKDVRGGSRADRPLSSEVDARDDQVSNEAGRHGLTCAKFNVRRHRWSTSLARSLETSKTPRQKTGPFAPWPPEAHTTPRAGCRTKIGSCCPQAIRSA